ncbi:MAG: AraC family ligand binding domain-containing protein, partial [Clostridia bacterium]|nr:AraC family ligand binding domain-containing protein [Clostridia bacterium]
MQHKWVTPLRNVEINIRQYGREECEPCHFFGPCVRDHFLLHFVANGKGKFASNGQEYALSGG